MVTLPRKKTDIAEIVAKRYYRYIYRIFGMLEVWLSDNASPFISTFLATINKLTGTKHRHGSPLHPQTQGAIEFTNQELDIRLRFYVDKFQDDWSDHLLALDFAHNSSWHSSIDIVPLKVALGHDIRNPLSLELPKIAETDEPSKLARQLVEQTQSVQKLARESALAAQKIQERNANRKRRPVDFGPGDIVFVKKKGFVTSAATTRLDSQ